MEVLLDHAKRIDGFSNTTTFRVAMDVVTDQVQTANKRLPIDIVAFNEDIVTWFRSNRSCPREISNQVFDDAFHGIKTSRA